MSSLFNNLTNPMFENKKVYKKIKRIKIPFMQIYFSTELFKKGLEINDNLFGVYSFCGKQGYGKTYAIVRWLYGWFGDGDFKIYSNLKKMDGVQYTYLNDIEAILSNREKNVIFFIDELAKKIEDNPRLIKRFYTWLGQSRKHKRIVIYTAQEWLMIDHKIRWFVKRNINVQPVFSYKNPIRRLVWGDAENITYDKLEAGYLCPVVSVEYIKLVPEIANLYDTAEAIE